MSTFFYASVLDPDSPNPLRIYFTYFLIDLNIHFFWISLNPSLSPDISQKNHATIVSIAKGLSDKEFSLKIIATVPVVVQTSSGTHFLYGRNFLITFFYVLERFR